MDYISTALNISPAEARALRDAATTQNQINDILKGRIKVEKQKVLHINMKKQVILKLLKKTLNLLNQLMFKKRDNGTITGTLADGRRVNVRIESRDTRPTLEIQNTPNNYTKIRYGSK